MTILGQYFFRYLLAAVKLVSSLSGLTRSPHDVSIFSQQVEERAKCLHSNVVS